MEELSQKFFNVDAMEEHGIQHIGKSYIIKIGITYHPNGLFKHGGVLICKSITSKVYRSTTQSWF